MRTLVYKLDTEFVNLFGLGYLKNETKLMSLPLWILGVADDTSDKKSDTLADTTTLLDKVGKVVGRFLKKQGRESEVSAELYKMDVEEIMYSTGVIAKGTPPIRKQAMELVERFWETEEKP